jgi:hypothetical protein
MSVSFSILKDFTLCLEEFEDTKGVIRIRISKKNRQNNGQKKKYKRTNNYLNIQKLYVHLFVTGINLSLRCVELISKTVDVDVGR